MIFFNFLASVLLFLPGILSDTVGILLLNSTVQKFIKNFIILKVLKVKNFEENNFQSDIIDGTFSYTHKKENNFIKDDN